MTQAQRQQREIDLKAVFEALERPLALVDSPERQSDIRRYIEAARVHLERSIFDLLSGAVQAVNESGGGVRSHLEYQAGVLHHVVEPAGEESGSDAEAEPLFSIEGDVEKVTIRIPAELKDLISQAANLRGTSVNTWYVRELARTISRQVRDQIRDQARDEVRNRRGERRRGSSLRGFVGE